jgi:CBS domain-containing protein
MNSRVCARNLMRSPIQQLYPTAPLDQAAGLFVRQGVKALPVVMGGGLVTVTERAALRRSCAPSEAMEDANCRLSTIPVVLSVS